VTPEAARDALAAVSDTPDLDLRLLRAHAGDDDARFERFIARRAAHEPVAYITGTRDFWTVTLEVTPDVLIPRPDSESLLDAAVAHSVRSARSASWTSAPARARCCWQRSTNGQRRRASASMRPQPRSRSPDETAKDWRATVSTSCAATGRKD
jgi:hypothetical protein